MIALWVRGLLRRRSGRLLGAGFGIALAVALLASLGSFLVASEATMTSRATAGVAVDWQVAVRPNAAVGAAKVLRTIQSDPGTRAAAPVWFADSSGLAATTAGTTQTTGAAKVLGIPSNYASTFPTAMRLLTGSLGGALVAQQTAANLHVGPGDSVTVHTAGLPPFTTRITGVVELPQADSLFQKVGAPSQSQPITPPDNVVLLPSSTFTSSYHSLITSGAPQITQQIHVARLHDLPPAPDAAFVAETKLAKNLEAATSGAAVVGDNLGAVLDAARGDAAYARILFLFLAAPGAILAGALTAAVTQAGAPRRREEQRLLRARGAGTAQLFRLVVAEGALVGVGGAIVGILASHLIGALAFGGTVFGAATGGALIRDAAAGLVGLLIAAAVIVLPARRELKDRPDARALSTSPRWLRYGLDIILIAVALGVFWAAGRNQYTLVLAPEGVPTLSVSYWAFLAPALAWVGAGLLSWRLADLLLGPGRSVLAVLLRPVGGNLARTSATMLSRQRRHVAAAAVLLGLSLSFAFSTATFNATYRQQAEADAQLTNGADVAVTESPGRSVPPSYAARLAAVGGVSAVTPVQHRFAYVGADLQDLYGIDSSSITKATTLQDPYFQGGTATEILARLAAHPDGVLVSAETVNDYQLSLGDSLQLRLQDSRTKSYLPITFHYVGTVNEFPTAPKDSFLVANASYVAQQTGDSSVGTFLVNTGGTNVGSVAATIGSIVGSTAKVSTINGARGLVGSSLTSVDLSGLTRLELAFALVISAASGGLVIGLGLAERRRTIAIATALGASRRQLRQLTAAEPLFVSVTGVAAGALAGWGMSYLLVKVLTGVFDPPPTTLAVPWSYLAVTAASAVGALGVAAALVASRTRATARDHLREI